jgi:hypothetical protein
MVDPVHRRRGRIRRRRREKSSGRDQQAIASLGTGMVTPRQNAELGGRLSFALGPAAAPRLLLSLRREVVDLVGVDVEDDLAAAGVAVADRYGRGVILVDLFAADV